MAGYVLWGGGPTRSMMVEAVLAEIGADYEVREVDILHDADAAAEMRARNPYGWVPALTTPGGETFGETPAINTWLCEEHGSNLVPAIGDADRPRYLAGYHYVLGEIEPTLKRIFFMHRYVLRPEDTAASRVQSWAMLDERIGVVDQVLAAGGPFFLGDRFTLADLTLAYWMAYAEVRGGLSPFPAVQRALDQTRARPASAPVFARLADAIPKFYSRYGRTT